MLPPRLRASVTKGHTLISFKRLLGKWQCQIYTFQRFVPCDSEGCGTRDYWLETTWGRWEDLHGAGQIALEAELALGLGLRRPVLWRRCSEDTCRMNICA